MKTDNLGILSVSDNGEMNFVVRSDGNENFDIYQLQLENIDKTSILVIENQQAEKKFTTPRLVPFKGTCLINDENKLQANISAAIKEIVKTITPKTTLTGGDSFQSMMSRYDQPKKVRQEAQKKDRRDRMDREELEKYLFDLFFDNEKLTFKELSDETQQPKAYLEGVLKSICDIQTSREGKFYVLKQDYKRKVIPVPGTPNDVEDLKEQPYKKFRAN